MPRIPQVSTLSANSVGILNVIKDNASPDYRQAVPTAEQTTESIRNIGTIIMGLESRRNEFINALVNRIAMVLVTSKSYTNTLSMFKKGYIELGETVEEIFVQLATPYQFDPETAESTVFKREIPNVKSMFHAINYQKYYKTTISNDMLRQAFLTWDGVTDLISRIVAQMYTGMAYDEYIMTKYLVARMILDGNMNTTTISDFTVATNADPNVTAIKTVSNNMEFMRTDYNIAGVENFSLKDEQYLLVSSSFSANTDVNSLAKAFNLDYVKFMGMQILVDSFSFNSGETARLATLLATDSTYTPFTSTELELLSTIGCVLVDKNFFMIFDNLQEATSIYNAQGLYYNEYLHVWKTFSASPFSNAVCFTTTTSAVTSVTVSPSTVTLSPDDTHQFNASVSGTGFFNKGVTWSVAGATKPGTKIGPLSGLLVIAGDETAAKLTITATSAFDATKTGTATVTIS